MANSTAIDTALITRLQGDTTLRGFMPDGVYFGVASGGKSHYVIVSLMIAPDDNTMFDEPAWETPLYLVKAVDFNTSYVNASNAADRIRVLLDRTTLTIPGYSVMSIQRRERVRYVEVDEANAEARWQHHGGQYAIQVCAD